MCVSLVVTDSQVEHSNLVGVGFLKTSEVALRNRSSAVTRLLEVTASVLQLLAVH